MPRCNGKLSIKSTSSCRANPLTCRSTTWETKTRPSSTSDGRRKARASPTAKEKESQVREAREHELTDVRKVGRGRWRQVLLVQWNWPSCKSKKTAYIKGKDKNGIHHVEEGDNERTVYFEEEKGMGMFDVCTLNSTEGHQNEVMIPGTISTSSRTWVPASEVTSSAQRSWPLVLSQEKKRDTTQEPAKKNKFLYILNQVRQMLETESVDGVRRGIDPFRC